MRKVGYDHHVVVLDVLSLGGLLVARHADVHAGLVLNFPEAGDSGREKDAKLMEATSERHTFSLLLH